MTNPPKWLPPNGGKLRTHVLKYGRSFTSFALNEVEHQFLMGIELDSRAVPMPPKGDRCFDTAAGIVVCDKTAMLKYSEGYVFHPYGYGHKRNNLIHHAWVTINGKVVDLLRGENGKAPGGGNNPVLGRFQNMEYFGVELSRQQICAMAKEDVVNNLVHHSVLHSVIAREIRELGLHQESASMP